MFDEIRAKSRQAKKRNSFQFTLHMELSMTKNKESCQDTMSEICEEEIRISGIYDTHYYNYRCRDCGYEAKPVLCQRSLKSAPKVRYDNSIVVEAKETGICLIINTH